MSEKVYTYLFNYMTVYILYYKCKKSSRTKLPTKINWLTNVSQFPSNNTNTTLFCLQYRYTYLCFIC